MIRITGSAWVVPELSNEYLRVFKPARKIRNVAKLLMC